MRATTSFTNFTSGEISDLLDGRTDLTRYTNAAKSLTNFVVHPAGGAARRPGTKFIHEVKSSATAVRLVPFEFNTTTANTYILEFGNLYFRVFRDGGIVTESTKTISAITQANPAVVTANSHGYSNDDHVIINSVVGMTEVNGKTFVVKNKTTNTFQIQDVDGNNINSTGYTAYSSAGTSAKIFEVTTPYTTAQVADIKFTQSADVMYLTHVDHEPRKLTRTAHTTWTLTTPDFVNGPYLDENSTTTTLTANARTGSSCTITSSADLFETTDVGRIIKIYEGYAKITSRTNATTVVTTVQTDEIGVAELLPTYTASTISFVEGDPDATGKSHNDFIRDSTKQFIEQGFKENMTITVSGASNSANNGDYEIVKVTSDEITLVPVDDVTNESASSSITIVGKLHATKDWSLGAFSETTGYPRACAFYEQRLVFAGTATQPQSLYFSVAGDFENFTEGDTDASALNYTIGSNQVNRIVYLASASSLLVGTTGGEFVVRASGTDEPLNPENAQVKKQASYGSADTQPAQIGGYTLFVQRAKRKIRELHYVYDTDSYQATDLTILADHVTENGIVELAYQQEPDSVVWAVTGDGRLLGLTYRREENVVAWHQHKLGGTWVDGSTTYNYGFVENIASIPGELNQDNLYMVVKRTINSVTRRFVEYLSLSDFGSDVTDAFFVDSGLTYSGSSVSTISGLDHLVGQTVSVLEEGSAHPTKTVALGAITLDRATTKAHVGLGYTSTLKTPRMEVPMATGTIQGKIKKIYNVTVRFFRTVGASVGTSSDNLDTVPFRDSSDAMDTAVPLFTGDKTIEAQPKWDTEGSIIVEQSQPLPMTVVSIYASVDIQNK